jgi:hypothetical protein
VVILPATGVTAKYPVVVLAPTNLTIQPPAKGVGEVTDQATVLPKTLYETDAGETPHYVIVPILLKTVPSSVGS